MAFKVVKFKRGLPPTYIDYVPKMIYLGTYDDLLSDDPENDSYIFPYRANSSEGMYEKIDRASLQFSTFIGIAKDGATLTGKENGYAEEITSKADLITYLTSIGHNNDGKASNKANAIWAKLDALNE